MPHDVQNRPPASREERFRSHALIEVKKFKHLPFGISSGVLLDLSISGFKLDLTRRASIKAGDHLWLRIPLTTLGISIPSSFQCKIECKWVDQEKFRLGGVFTSLSSTDRMVIDQIVQTLEDRRTS